MSAVPAGLPQPTFTGPLLFYAGPRDGTVGERRIGEAPERIQDHTGDYIRMDAIPGWMHFLPERSMDTVIYVWEPAYAC